jgi:hypothetical protein
MAVDIIQDMELNQPPRLSAPPNEPVTSDEMTKMRTYLACYYLISSYGVSIGHVRKTALNPMDRFASTRHRRAPVSLEYSSWTATCAMALERNPQCEGDMILCWLVRISHLVEEAATLCRGRRMTEQSDGQTRLMLMGLESQLREWQRKIPPSVASNRMTVHHCSSCRSAPLTDSRRCDCHRSNLY